MAAVAEGFVHTGLRFDRSIGEAGGCHGQPSTQPGLQVGAWYEAMGELGGPVDDPGAEPSAGQRVELVLWDQDHALDEPMLVRIAVFGPSGDIKAASVLQPRDAATIRYPTAGDDSSGLAPGV